MRTREPVHRRERSVLHRVIRVIAKIVLTILALLVLVILLIQIPYIQGLIKTGAEKYLTRKLKTRVEIGRLYIRFPETILLSNIYVEDRRKDTLFSAGLIHVNLRMWALLHNRADIQVLQLSDLTMKVNRQLPDSIFNYQFIVDAFAGNSSKKPPAKTGSSMKISLGTLALDKIRMVYKDEVSGNEVEAWLGYCRTNGFSYDAFRSSPMEISRIGLAHSKLDYRNTRTSFTTNLRVGRLETVIKDIDLEKNLVGLASLQLDSSFAAIRFGKTGRKEAKSRSPDKYGSRAPIPPATDSSGDWKVLADALQLKENSFQFDDDNQPRQVRGMDYFHLKARGLSLQATQILYHKDSIFGKLANARLREQSGFQLDKLQAEFGYTDHKAYLKDLELRTPGTLLRKQAAIQYSSLTGMVRDPVHTLIDFDLPDCRVQVKDLLVFVPFLYQQPVFSRPAETWRINARVKGSLADLKIGTLQFSGLEDIKLDLSGNLKYPADMKKIAADLDIRQCSGSRKSLSALLPKGVLPANLSIPETFGLRGKINGSMDGVKADLAVQSSSGNMTVKGNILQFRDLRHASYDIDMHTVALDLAHILRDTLNFGRLTADIAAKGKGLTLQDANAMFKGRVRSATLRGYTYTDLLFEGGISGQRTELTASIDDTAIRFNLQAAADLSSRFPSVRLDWQIDTLDLHALFLMKDTFTFKGHVSADFPATNPDSLAGRLRIDSMVSLYNGSRLVTDSILFIAERDSGLQDIRLRSELASLDWKGRYKLTEVPRALEKAIDQYYHLHGAGDTLYTTGGQPAKDTFFTSQDWQLHLALLPSPMVLALVPALRGSDSAYFHASFNSDRNDLNLVFGAPRIQYGSTVIRRLGIEAATAGNQLKYNIEMAGATGYGIQLYRTGLYGNLAGNRLNTSLLVRDADNDAQYRLSGVLENTLHGVRFAFNPDSLLLDNDPWQVSRDNYIRYDSGSLFIHNLRINKNDEALLLQSLLSDSAGLQPPMEAVFSNFRISTLTRFAGQDSLLMDGILNGKATVKNMLTAPVFTSDLRVKDLQYKGDSVGDLVIRVDNEHTNAFAADISLEGHRNDARLSGQYYTGDGHMDMKLDLQRLNLEILKPLAGDQLEDSKGYLKGKLGLTGTFDKPVLNGNLYFDSAVITPAISGEPLKPSSDRIEFDADGFNFSNFSLADMSGNKATLDGNVYTSDYRDYRFDLSLNARNFRLVNAPPGGNRIVYGKLSLDAGINLGGDIGVPKVDGNIRVNRETNFTFVLPGSDPEVINRQGVVRFVTPGQKRDTSAARPGNFTARQKMLRGMEVGLNISTDSNAVFTMVVDERSGDALQVRGRSNLVYGIDKNGRMELTGTYEVESGYYDLSLDPLKRRFAIQRGSSITWTGDPYSAVMDITATYSISTAPIDLLSNEIANRPPQEVTKFKQKLPFLVKLNMTGELMKPAFTFDVTLPPGVLTQWPDVDQKLQQLRVQESDMNKQVFALLLLNRFVGDDPLQSAASGTTVGNMAFQSASQLLTGQLDRLAASLIKGVDIHFDLNSQQDFSTGQQNDYTQMGVTVSKRFFNDRIQVNVGSSFDVQGNSTPNQNASNIAGNVAVDYKLSKDGRYMLRAYSKNQYQMSVEGQVVETGVSFILTFDYDRFRDLFRRVQEEKLSGRKAGKPSRKTNP